MRKIRLKPERIPPELAIVQRFASKYVFVNCIAGGCVAAIFDKTKPKDYDVFYITGNVEDLKLNLAADGIDFTERKNVISLNYNGLDIQLIVNSGIVEHVIPYRFDFTCCMFAYYNGNIYSTFQSRKDAVRKRLKLVNLTNTSTKYRILRYRQKGYSNTTQTVLEYIKQSKHLIHSGEYEI